MRRWQIALIGGLCVAGAGVWLLGMYFYATAHDGNFPESTGIGVKGGVPFVVHAYCGSPEPIGYLEVREVSPGSDSPSDSDPVVFVARATDHPSGSVPLSQHVDGYEVQTFEPLEASSRYYIYDLRSTTDVNGLPTAPDFRTTDLVEGATMTLYDGEDVRVEGSLTPNAQWVEATSC